MKRRIVKSGEIYNNLTILKELKKRGKTRMVLCKCICGKEVKVQLFNLLSGHSKSCGCQLGTHNMSNTLVYNSWQAMRHRVLDGEKKCYKNIKICKRWLSSFDNFYKDMGDRPKDRTLDRINNEKGYFPSNCRWATIKQQSLNKSSNRRINCNGKNLTITEWANILGIKRKTLYQRLRNGWRELDVIKTPLGKHDPEFKLKYENNNRRIQ